MTALPEPGTRIDGFTLGERLHGGAQGSIYRVTAPPSGFPLAMKLPRVGAGEPGENVISFETEASILPLLNGPHVPRVVKVGDIAQTPYLVMEWIAGESLAQRLAQGPQDALTVARLGAAAADAIHELHLQDAIHLDIKPDNIVLRPDGTAVLIDFGLSHHAHLPDLLAEERRHTAGSAPYVSPEQVLGTRQDPRSDLFALGVVLYELATGELPFGTPQTMAGLRDRIWRDPEPPRALRPEIPEWLQEIILHCLEPQAARRYQSAALLAFDLRHPDKVQITARGRKSAQAGLWAQLQRWWHARHHPPRLRMPPAAHVTQAPVIMVAIDTLHPDDPRQPVLQRATARQLALSPEYRLICVSVVPAGALGDAASASNQQVEHLLQLRHWVEPLRLPQERLSLHVLESARPETTLVEFARNNHADLLLLGAPRPDQHALAWWRSVASGVTANAHCSVFVVRAPEGEAPVAAPEESPHAGFA